MVYDPISYWNSRKNPNSSDVAPVWIKEYIAPFTKGIRSVFELGPGVGRTFEVYEPGTAVVTLDLSKQYEQQLNRRADAGGLKLAQHFLSDPAGPFPFPADAFQIGVCAQVLMHVLPQHIAHSMEELSRICQSSVVVAGVNQDWDKKPGHCFNHDYLRICEDIGNIAQNVVCRKDSICFVMRKNTKSASNRTEPIV